MFLKRKVKILIQLYNNVYEKEIRLAHEPLIGDKLITCDGIERPVIDRIHLPDRRLAIVLKPDAGTFDVALIRKIATKGSGWVKSAIKLEHHGKIEIRVHPYGS